MEKTLRDNREIKASDSAVAAAKADRDGAFAKYLPSVSVTAAYTHLNDDIEIDLHDLRSAMIASSAASATAASGNPAVGNAVANQLNAALPNFVLPIQKQDFTFATVNLMQPLFTGGKITANKRAKEELYNNSQTESTDTQGRILVELVQQYFTVQLASKVREVRNDSLTTFKEHQRIAAALVKQGQLSRAQKMKVDVAVADAESALSKSIRDENLAKKVLANTLELSDTDFNLTTPLSLKPLKPMESYSSTAGNENFSLKQIHHKRSLLEAKQTAARSEFYPTLALIGSYEFYEKDLTELAPKWFVGVALKMNIFNGGGDKSDLNVISQQKVYLDYFEGHANTLVNIGVEKYYSEILNAKEQYDTLQKTKSLAEESLRLNNSAFKNGFSKSTDVIDSELALLSVRLNELKVLYDYNSNYVQLLKFSGQKDEIVAIYKAEEKTP
ncbi:TolC family protein [Bdellovibrio sp. NC01]|uniref:TolC family protein n=1 Tax=Bdellovibrio sp. NC01 TaxID=2220073 RepID=UPI001AF01566|nr:TolC family protein [Bdellovibrio sp. NC01]